MKFISSDFSGNKITSVKVNTSKVKTGSSVLSVSVNGRAYKYNGSETYTTTTTATEVEFTSDTPQEGEIVILWSQPDAPSDNKTSAAIYCKGITVTYEKAESTGPVDFKPNFENLDLKVGDMEEIKLPADAPAVIFTSNDACVDVAGNVISADAEGTATITATWSANDKWKAGSATFTVNVSKNVYAPDWKDIVLEEDGGTTIALGDTHPEIAFESSDDNVAMIDDTGYILAGTAGTATITAIWGDAKWADGEKTFTVTVTKALAEVTMSWPDANVSVNLGDEFTAQTLTINPEAALAEVKYSSSKPEVAAFEDGKLVIKGAGTTTVTAAISDSKTYKPASAEYTLTVVDPNAPTEQTIDVDFTVAENYGLTPKNGNSTPAYEENDITYTFENGLVMTLFKGNSQNGFRQWTVSNSSVGYDLRLYANSGIRFTAPDEFELTKIEFKVSPANSSVIDLSNSVTTANPVWTAEEEAGIGTIAFNANSQTRLATVKVTLVKELPMVIPLLEKNGNEITVSTKYSSHAIAWRVRPYEESAAGAPARAVAATEWATLEKGTPLTHTVDANESYYLDVKAVRGTRESEAVTMKMIHGEVTGITDITVDSAEVEYYNLQGIRVINPENGIFIRRQGNKVTKVIL